MNLINSIVEVQADDPLTEEYREAGVAAHKLASLALWSEKDAWELSEMDMGWKLGADDLVAVQVYLDYINSIKKINTSIEEEVGVPELNQHLHGTLDWSQFNEGLLEIVDYKHGVGVVVDAENNFQLLYYAFCKLMKLKGIQRVKMTICQPRAIHWAGPIRSWEVDAQEVFEWGNEVLLPAMHAAETSNELHPGSHCQFCPAKLYCKAALDVFDESTAEANAVAMSDEMLAERFSKIQVVMFVKKAIEQEVLKRTLDGHTLPGVKLVQQKADRVWKDGAELIFRNKPEAWTEPQLKSPAKMEKITGLSSLVVHCAFKPATGYVAAREDDRRHAVTLPSAGDAFQSYATKELEHE
jgi:hypothetical protein